MNDFRVKTNNKGEYCLKDISDNTKFLYKYLLKKFGKNYITKKELVSFINGNLQYSDIVEFRKKFTVFEKHKWIGKADSIMNELKINLKIDFLFINLWTALENQIDVKIVPRLVNFMGFCDNNIPCCKETECNLKFITFLKHNKINYELKTLEKKSSTNSSTLENKDVYVTIDDFKSCIMMLNNDRSNDAKKYFSQLEKIFNNYKNQKYMELLKQNQESRKKLNDKEFEVNELKRINSNMEIVLQNVKMRNKDGYIYIASSKSLAKDNLFRIGYTDNLKTRLSTLNNKKSLDRMYYCHYQKAFNIKKVDKIIHDILEDFTSNQYIKLHYNYLFKVVDLTINNINEPYEYVNNLFKNGIKESCSLRPVIPPEMEVEENYGLSQQQMIDAIIKILNRYGVRGISKITRKQLLSDLVRELQCNVKQREMWSLFKKEFKWTSSVKPIECEKFKIKVEFYEK